MFKLLDFDPINKYGEPTVINIGRADDTIKTASLSSGAYAPEINSFIANLKPVIGKLYALINAMGATEFFSCNRNGDAFYEDALKKYHPTFVENGHAFMHHKNKDPEKSYGKVIFSAYNDKMHRVELIVEYDIDKLDPKFAQRIDNGEMVNVSMGCRVDSDYCSICGNRAKSPAFYCEHLTNNPGLTRCLPDGRKAFAINRDPHFFDISIVTIPADPTARVMAKIAADHNLPVSSVQRAWEDDTFMKLARRNEKPYQIKTASVKQAEDTVRVINMSPEKEDTIAKVVDGVSSCFDRAIGPDIPEKILNLIGSLDDSPIRILKGFIKRRIFLRPRETQRIVLVSSGMKDIADTLDKNNTVVLNNPEKGLSLFDNEDGTAPDAFEALPELFKGLRSMTPVNIRKITIRVVSEEPEACCSPEEKIAMQTMPVTISDDMKYLMGQGNDYPVNRQGSDDLKKTIAGNLASMLVLGSIIAAFDSISGSNPVSLAQDARVVNELTPMMFDAAERVNQPVQEMQFLNPNSPQAIETALLDAMRKVNPEASMLPVKTSAYKQADFDLLNSIKTHAPWAPKAAIALPMAYGISSLISNDAQKEDMANYQNTGKYSPSLLSRKSVTFPLAAAALMKLSSARRKAKDYIKKASLLGLPKSKVLASLEGILYTK